MLQLAEQTQDLLGSCDCSVIIFYCIFFLTEIFQSKNMCFYLWVIFSALFKSIIVEFLFISIRRPLYLGAVTTELMMRESAQLTHLDIV